MSRGTPRARCVCLCVLYACLHVRDDWAKVLPHCLFSVSIASLCISVFFTALFAFNNMPKAHHRGSETPSVAVVIIFVCEILKCLPSEQRCALVCVLSDSMCVLDLSPRVFFFFFALCMLIWEEAYSLGLQGGVFSADFVWFKARGSYRSIETETHHGYVQQIGCGYGKQPQLNSENSYVNMLFKSFNYNLELNCTVRKIQLLLNHCIFLSYVIALISFLGDLWPFLTPSTSFVAGAPVTKTNQT